MRWCQPFGSHSICSTNIFVCNFLSSSAGFIPCNYFHRLTLALHFRSFGFPCSLPPDFSYFPSQFRYLALLYVSFLPSLIHSHSCSSGAFLLFLSPLVHFVSGIFCFPSAFFRPLLLCFQLLILLHFLSPFAVSPHNDYLSILAFFLSVSGLFPLAFALGSGYSAWNLSLSRYLPSARFLRVNFHIFTPNLKSQHLFLKISTFFKFCKCSIIGTSTLGDSSEIINT